MQVLTFDPETLEAAASRLAEMLAVGETAYFDAVVGVARGGSFVCDAFLKRFPKTRYGKRYDISLQRPSTKKKEGKLRKLLKMLPLPVLDALRMAESLWLSAKRKISRKKTDKDVEISDELGEIIGKKTDPHILVIDDAIDSGDTMRAIVDAMIRVNPTVRVVTAVLTVTTGHPLIIPDFSLYSDRTLIRFPWSNDYKNR